MKVKWDSSLIIDIKPAVEVRGVIDFRTEGGKYKV
jgi:hypothetical protein